LVIVAVTQKHSALRDAQNQHKFVGLVEINTQALLLMAVCVRREVVEAQRIVLQEVLRYSAVSKAVTSA
jgi:hypothetical protein